MLNDFPSTSTNQQVTRIDIENNTSSNSGQLIVTSFYSNESDPPHTLSIHNDSTSTSQLCGSVLSISSTSSSSSSSIGQDYTKQDIVQTSDLTTQYQTHSSHQQHPLDQQHANPQTLVYQKPYFSPLPSSDIINHLTDHSSVELSPIVAAGPTGPSSSIEADYHKNKTLAHNRLPSAMNVVEPTAQQHGDIVPAAHSSSATIDQQQVNGSSGSSSHNMHYSLPSTKSLTNSNTANMALNFSHDLFLQAGHHGGGQQTSSSTSSTNNTSTLHHQQNNNDTSSTASATSNDNNLDLKPQLNSFELDSGSLMQSVGMWKNTMSLGHFKHPAITDHASFLPGADINSFSNWPHGGNIGQQATQTMTHHILDSQHLALGYPQHHQRAANLMNNGQDIVGASLKNQVATDQATSFMLNSINHQAAVSSHSVPNSSHQQHQSSHDNLTNIRSQSLGDHHSSATYSLAMNDNQFYNSSRAAENNRSHHHHHHHHNHHQNPIKPQVLLSDRSVQLSLTNHHAGHLSYHHNGSTTLDGTTNQQPTTSHHLHNQNHSHHHHQMPGSSSSGSHSSKTTGNFKCSHCGLTFTMRNLYQSHLRTHSQEKGTKAKFSCELCGHSFSQKTSLNRHMKSHTGERPFPCEVCGKAFSEKERLKIHMRTHTGEKPFSCQICGKSFSQKSTVKRHQTVHTGEKKFKCDCGKGFANRGNLIAHIKTRGANHFE